MNDYRDSIARGDVSCGVEAGMADVQPQTDDAVGDDVLVSGGSLWDGAKSVAIGYRALEWLYRELKRAKIAYAHAERRPGVRQAELEAIENKIEIIDWLIGETIRKV